LAGRKAGGRMVDFVLAMILIGATFLAPAQISWYDPALGGINCDHDCGVVGATTRFHESMYGNVLACPIEFPRGTKFTITSSRGGLANGTWTCLDGGGSAVLTDTAIRLDLMSDHPIWAETVMVRVEFPRWIVRESKFGLAEACVKDKC